MKTVTCIAPVNIAVIKYWGKRDEALILPINDSLSATLSTDQMCTKTTVFASPNFESNEFWLNGKPETFESPRLLNCLSEVKSRAEPGEILKWNIHVCSENNFPTAAGLASSAAGYACLVSALSALYGIKGDISDIARRGSGSACRSVYGGWVRWNMGVDASGEDSVATQIFPASHWPEMRIIVLVVNAERKKCNSTPGMKLTLETSELIQFRAKNIVPKRISKITEAIRNKNFDVFAQFTMQDSNQFHAVCLDSFPPLVYMNDISHAIVELVHAYNSAKGSNKVAYTFDAGPNACLYLLESEVEEVLALVNAVFPNDGSVDYFRGISVEIPMLCKDLEQKLNLNKQPPGSLKYIIHTKVGDGPKFLTLPSDHLLNEAGLPKA